MPTLGKFIQRRRVELGLTQEQLAEQIGSGVRQSEISRLEHDRLALPRRQRLEQIALALDVSLGQLLARSGWAEAEHAFSPGGMDQPAAPDSGLNPEAYESEALADAMARAEQLIADSDAIVEKSQETFDQANKAVRYTRNGRHRKPVPQ